MSRPSGFACSSASCAPGGDRGCVVRADRGFLISADRRCAPCGRRRRRPWRAVRRCPLFASSGAYFIGSGAYWGAGRVATVRSQTSHGSPLTRCAHSVAAVCPRWAARRLCSACSLSAAATATVVAADWPAAMASSHRFAKADRCRSICARGGRSLAAPAPGGHPSAHQPRHRMHPDPPCRPC